MVEKPKAEDAPSLYAAAGRYVLDRAIFDALRRIDRGVGGEMQLTDAIALLIAEGHPVHVVVHRGSRHDLGNPGGYLKAAVDFALDRDDYGPDLRRWLVTRLGLAEASRQTYGAGQPDRGRRQKGALCVRLRSSRPGYRPPRWRRGRCVSRSPRRKGLMCAEEVVTERPLPGFDQAAIDGYAVRSVDVLGVGQADRTTTCATTSARHPNRRRVAAV